MRERTGYVSVFFKKSNQAFAVQVILQTFGYPSFIRKLATVYVSNNFCLENIQAQTVPLLENKGLRSLFRNPRCEN